MVVFVFVSKVCWLNLVLKKVINWFAFSIDILVFFTSCVGVAFVIELIELYFSNKIKTTPGEIPGIESRNLKIGLLKSVLVGIGIAKPCKFSEKASETRNWIVCEGDLEWIVIGVGSKNANDANTL